MKAATLLRRDSNTGVCEIFKNTFFSQNTYYGCFWTSKRLLNKKKSLKIICVIICVQQANFKSYSPQLATFLTLSFITDDLKCLNIVAQQICKDKLKRIFCLQIFYLYLFWFKTFYLQQIYRLTLVEECIFDLDCSIFSRNPFPHKFVLEFIYLVVFSLDLLWLY